MYQQSKFSNGIQSNGSTIYTVDTRLAKFLNPKFQPNIEYHYADANYSLLKIILRLVTSILNGRFLEVIFKLRSKMGKDSRVTVINYLLVKDGTTKWTEKRILTRVDLLLSKIKYGLRTFHKDSCPTWATRLNNQYENSANLF